MDPPGDMVVRVYEPVMPWTWPVQGIAAIRATWQEIRARHLDRNLHGVGRVQIKPEGDQEAHAAPRRDDI